MAKKKGKDPAFLFYSEKWIAETYFLTQEEKGVYIDLLALQHSIGHLEPKMFYKVTGGVEYPNVLKEFKVDSKGNLYNAFLDAEIERRKEFSNYQSARAKKRWDKEKDAVASAESGAVASAESDARESNSMRTKTETITIATIPIDSIDANTYGSLDDLYEN